MLVRSYRMLFSIAQGARTPVTLTLHFRGRDFNATFESSADFALIREIFLDEEYAHTSIENAKAIFDVGANVGMASIYFSCLYPSAQIYAFEPDAIIFEKLSKRTNGFENIHPYKLALSDTDGEMTFYSDPDRPLSGSLLERQKGESLRIVQTRSISSMVDELGVAEIDLLKFDIEGGEGRLFALEADRNRSNRLIGEVHLDLMKTDKQAFANIFSGFKTSYLRQTAPGRYIFFAKRV